MSTDFRGDPSAALMEVLDPEQNTTFNDHYLDVDSRSVKILLSVRPIILSGFPVPSRTAWEIIRIPGYTEWEKLNIAKHFLCKSNVRQTV